MTLFETVKTVFFLTMFIYVAPFLMENIKEQYSFLFEIRTSVGIIPIPKHFDTTIFLSSLYTYFKNTSIKAIVIKIDNAIIAAGTSQSIFHDIQRLKKEYPKPIVALIENTCLAGTYLIASACDYIIAPESALIGNIGKDFLSIDTETSHETSDTLKGEAYQQLTKHIALSRKLSLATVNNWAEGKIFIGTQACALGLINEIGSLNTAIKIIKNKAPIEGEIQWVEKQEKNPSKFLYSLFLN